MNFKTFVICFYDVKADYFHHSLFFPHKADAFRAIEKICNDEASQFFHHPDDYQFFGIGEFCPKTGKIEYFADRELLGTPRDFQKKLKVV